VDTHHSTRSDGREWIISKYLAEQAFIEYIVFKPERVEWIAIQCHDDTPSHTGRAEITYTLTGLPEKGNALNKKYLQTLYAHDLKDWEDAINYHLKTGEKRKHHRRPTTLGYVSTP
jgi:hypothetical protein